MKFLPESTARHPGLLERFHGEVRIARQVSHPNVCRVYDIAEVDRAAYISMEYVDGEDLGSLVTIEISNIFSFRHRHPVVAPEVAGFSFDTALFVRLSRRTKLRFKAASANGTPQSARSLPGGAHAGFSSPRK